MAAGLHSVVGGITHGEQQQLRELQGWNFCLCALNLLFVFDCLQAEAAAAADVEPPPPPVQHVPTLDTVLIHHILVVRATRRP